MAKLVIGNDSTTGTAALVRDISPTNYLEFTVDANGKAEKSSKIMNFKGIKDTSNYVFQNLYNYDNNISGVVDMSDLTSINGVKCCQSMFYNCTNITGVDLSSLKKIWGEYPCYQMFSGCTSLTNVDLSNLTEVGGYQGAANYMFYGCTSLTNVDLSNLTSVAGSQACMAMFSGCTSLTNVDLSNLTTISISQGCSQMFYNCTGLTSVDLSGLTALTSSSCCSIMFSNCTGLTSVDLSNLTSVVGSYAFQQGFQNCTSLASISFPKLVRITGSGCRLMFSGCSNLSSVNIPRLTYANSLEDIFKDCTSLTELRFSGLMYNSNLNNSSFYNMLNGCSNVTVHFPAEWETIMENWTNVTSGFGGTNTTVLFDLPTVTTLDLSDITSFKASQFSSAFSGCTNLTSVDLSNLTEIVGNESCQYMFSGCTSLTSVDLSKLEKMDYAMTYTFNSCTSLTELRFPSLKTVKQGRNSFNYMLYGVTGCTVHFPSNLSSYNFNCGGTNTIVLYDLPATE